MAFAPTRYVEGAAIGRHYLVVDFATLWLSLLAASDYCRRLEFAEG